MKISHGDSFPIPRKYIVRQCMEKERTFIDGNRMRLLLMRYFCYQSKVDYFLLYCLAGALSCEND